MCLTIAIDYDDTFTADPALWTAFVQMARARWHAVFVTTARFPHDLADVYAALPDAEVIASGGKPKANAAEAYGVGIDIWIDDSPHLIGKLTFT